MTTSSDASPCIAQNRPKRICKSNVFYQPEDSKYDPDLKTAIKKSMVEKIHKDINYQVDLSEIPAIEPSEELFHNPISIFEKYQHLGCKYGAVKLIPPKNWKPPFSLNWDSINFQVREQHINQLSTGKSFNHPERAWNMKEFSEENDKLKKTHFGKENVVLDEIERTYWKLVEDADKPVTVLYAADLKTNALGSGFPSDPSSIYSKHPWNLQQLPYVDGSLLKYYHRDVPGITSPWLYLGMIFSCFCWHTEDNFFASVNYQHFGSPKVWYVVPPARAASVERLLKNYAASLSSYAALHSLTVQLTPSILCTNKIPVYRCVQNENEFILLWPRTFHAGFNSGLNCNEACNLAPAFWLDFGYRSINAYRYLRSTCIPFFQLVVRSASRYKEWDVSALFFLCKYLLQFLYDEYAARSAMNLPQFPLHLSPNELQKIKTLNEDTYIEIISITGALEFITPTPLVMCESSEELFENCAAVAKIPSKDCDNCQTSCFSGCVMCPHISSVHCAHCAEVHECDCKQKIYLYRFSLYIIKRLVETVTAYYSHLVESTNSSNRLQDESLYKYCQKLDVYINKIEDSSGLKCLDVNGELDSWEDVHRLETPVKFSRSHSQTSARKRSGSKEINCDVATNWMISSAEDQTAKKEETNEVGEKRSSTPVTSRKCLTTNRTDTKSVCSIPFVQQATWKYLLLAARSEAEEDDTKFLPSVEITATTK